MGASRPFGTIRKLPSGRFQARYWHLGKQVAAETLFASKTDARTWLARMETDLQGGRHVDPSSGRERFADFAQAWLDSRDLRPRTRETYESQLNHILPEFGPLELRRITPPLVRAWHGRLSQSRLHPNTVAKVYRMFRTILDSAVDDGLLRVNPVHIKGAAVERSVERPALKWSDVQRIADAIHPSFHALVWLGATSGLRFGELAALTRSQVDVEARTLRVERSLTTIKGQGVVLGPPKSASAHRTVTLPASAAELLADHMRQHVAEGPDSLIFTSVTGSALLNGYFAPHWKRALRSAGLAESIRFHDLRHLAGTSAATAGASLREIMARMGHSSPAASLRYLQASERRDAEIAHSIEARMSLDLERQAEAQQAAGPMNK